MNSLITDNNFSQSILDLNVLIRVSLAIKIHKGAVMLSSSYILYTFIILSFIHSKQIYMQQYQL